MPEGDMDPEAAAKVAMGDEADAGAFDGSFDSGSDGPVARLFDGDADGPSVQELEADYSLPKAPAIALRGVLRVATGSGIPPAAEILLGGVMWVIQADATNDDDGGIEISENV